MMVSPTFYGVGQVSTTPITPAHPASLFAEWEEEDKVAMFHARLEPRDNCWKDSGLHRWLDC